MDKNETIEQVLGNMDTNTIFRKKKSPLQGIFLLVLGGVFFTINTSMIHNANEFMSSLLMMLGSISIILAITAIVFRKNHFFASANKQKLKLHEYSFDANDRDKLVKCIETGHFKELKNLKKSTNDGLKLRIMSTQDATICFSQVIIYIPYEYVNVTAVKEHNTTESEALVEALKSI